MIIGVPKEVKIRENRVGLIPGGVRAFVAQGHKVLVQKGAGIGVSITDTMYEKAGAIICDTAVNVWSKSQMIIKVKEPILEEYSLLKEDHILYTYLHLASEEALTRVLLKQQVSAVAYETIQALDGSLPLLRPMSEVAGRMSVQVGAKCLEKHNGGKGLLLGGVPGVRRGRVVIIGGGVVGINAAKIAVGMGASVSIIDIDQARLAYLDDIFGSKVSALMSTPEVIAREVQHADLVIGAVLDAGAKAPVLVTKEMVKTMALGSAIVDVSIDQGGCVETIKPTDHDQPFYQCCGVNHYGVTNIPGDVPMTSTYALTNVTLKYGLELANKGLQQALKDSKALLHGLNTYRGKLTYKAVAVALGMEYVDAEELLSE